MKRANWRMTKKLPNTEMMVKTPDFYVVIPARYASTRLPGKPLLDIAGKPMVVWVVERAIKSGAKQVVVATDDVRIFDVVNHHGYRAVMTRANHASGTDRIAEVAQHEGWADDAIVLNVQGDEPLIEAGLMLEVVAALNNSVEAVMATACHAIQAKADLINPNIVKVVLDAEGHALYFSRAPIPYPRDSFLSDALLPVAIPAYRHIGIYAYRAAFLKQYASLPQSALEVFECLEQLRVLHQGYKIAVSVSSNAPLAGVDTEADLMYVRSLIAAV